MPASLPAPCLPACLSRRPDPGSRPPATRLACGPPAGLPACLPACQQHSQLHTSHVSVGDWPAQSRTFLPRASLTNRPPTLLFRLAGRPRRPSPLSSSAATIGALWRCCLGRPRQPGARGSAGANLILVGPTGSGKTLVAVFTQLPCWPPTPGPGCGGAGTHGGTGAAAGGCVLGGACPPLMPPIFHCPASQETVLCWACVC